MSSPKPSLCEQKHFDALFNEHFEAARNFIYYKCGDVAQAEDIVQDSFVKLWDRCAQIILEKAKNYLFRMCNNALMNQFEHQKVVLRHQAQPQNTKNIEDPAYLIEEAEFKEKLENAINLLSDKEREVFLLSRIDQKSYKEIAEIVGIGVKAVERRMGLALMKLREEMGKHLKF